tara:strand:+ start:226 stop:810 length:585 start_codon:yes stop_codon:yes gene_type:complete
MDFFEKMPQIQLVLASQSPRRRFLLQGLGLNPTIRPVSIDETPLSGESARQCAERLAQEKVRAASCGSREVVLAADTLVGLNNRVLGKPKSPEDAKKMLGELSGQWHEVVTGLAVRSSKKLLTGSVVTRVEFRDLSTLEIAAYVASEEPLDKAGSYGIQGHGGALVRNIEGDYPNVVGLPIQALFELLEELGEP